jgi:hypothetical protein
MFTQAPHAPESRSRPGIRPPSNFRKKLFVSAFAITRHQSPVQVAGVTGNPRTTIKPPVDHRRARRRHLALPLSGCRQMTIGVGRSRDGP